MKKKEISRSQDNKGRALTLVDALSPSHGIHLLRQLQFSLALAVYEERKNKFMAKISFQLVF